MGKNQITKSFYKLSIRIKVILIIIAIVVGITLSSLVPCFLFSSRNFLLTVEKDMEVIGRIAEQMVSNEIGLLKEESRTMAARLAAVVPEDLVEVLHNVAKHTRFRDVAILDAQGGAVYYGKPLMWENEYLTNPYALRAFAGETVLGNPVKDPSGELVIRVWTPLDNNRVLAGILPGAFFCDIIGEFRIWETGGIFILDEHGRFVGHRQAELVLKEYHYIEMGKIEPSLESTGRFFERMIQGGSGLGYYTFNGRERLGFYMPIEKSDGFVL
ncbi:MAG: hypothetical protein LBO80_02805, partial [Treponema sp.]|nr:hypothetical protein [Treponema sp.]